MGARLSYLINRARYKVRRATRRTKRRLKAWEEVTFNTFQAFAYLPYESDDKSIVHKVKGHTLYYETKLDRTCRPFDVTIDFNTTIDSSSFPGVDARESSSLNWLEYDIIVSGFVIKKFDFNDSSWIAIRVSSALVERIQDWWSSSAA